MIERQFLVALPGTATRHMIARFSYGYNYAQHNAVNAAGGPQKWFATGIRPAS